MPCKIVALSLEDSFCVFVVSVNWEKLYYSLMFRVASLIFTQISSTFQLFLPAPSGISQALLLKKQRFNFNFSTELST